MRHTALCGGSKNQHAVCLHFVDSVRMLKKYPFCNSIIKIARLSVRQCLVL